MTLKSTIMKTRIVLRSLDELSPKLVAPETATPVPALPQSNVAGLQQQQLVPLRVRQREHSRSENHRHWGINE